MTFYLDSANRKIIAVIVVGQYVATIERVSQSYETRNALQLFLGIAAGLLSSSFVFLTGEWYGPTPAGASRLLIWACGLPLFTGIMKQIFDLAPSPSALKSYPLVMATVRILLSVYAFFFVGTPDQVHWTHPWDRALYVSMQSRIQDSRPRKASKARRNIDHISLTARR